MKRLEPLAFVFLFASLGYTLFAWVPASDLRDLTKVETHAAFAAIPDAGHFAHEESPADVNQHIRRFLTEVYGPIR